MKTSGHWEWEDGELEYQEGWRDALMFAPIFILTLGALLAIMAGNFGRGLLLMALAVVWMPIMAVAQEG